MNTKRTLVGLLVVFTMLMTLGGCNKDNSYPGATKIQLSDNKITVDGKKIGTDSGAAVYESADIIYYEDRETYESGNPYGEGTAEERHTAEEAAAHRVVNITQPGTYVLRGSLSAGQVRVDLGDDAKINPDAVVTLILDSVEITSTVAPAILFQNVYECDGDWSTETAQATVDTSAAGANVIIADDSTNIITGSHVAKIYKDQEGEKKLWKQDGAFYSYMSMNVMGEEDGNGILNIEADNEGLDSELHLTIHGGWINIYSGDDGINTNEDGVSVTTINGGILHIVAGLGAEGDGIDSNGWLVINGGTVIAMANPASDAGLDSDMGSYVNGGTVVALGSTMDWAESESLQVTNNLQFAEYQEGGQPIVMKDEEGNVVFAYNPIEDEVVADYIRKYQGAILSCGEFTQGQTYRLFVGDVQQAYTGTDVRRRPSGLPPEGEFRFEQGQRPEGMELPERPADWDPGQRPERPEGMERPEGFEPPEGAEPPSWNLPMDPGLQIGEPSTEFFMQDAVNFFSGVAAAEQ